MVEAGTSSQNSPKRWWTREVARQRALVARMRELFYRVLDTVPPARRSVDDLVRIEVVDRSMAIGAQALLALVPMAIVLAAFLPQALTHAGMDRIEAVTGLGSVADEIAKGAEGSGLTATPDAEQVRTTTGFIGLLITLLSASSFGRAVQRLYEQRLGPAARRRLRRYAPVAVLAVPLATGDAGGRADRSALQRGGPNGARSGVLGAPGGAHRRDLVVVDAGPARTPGGVVAPGVPGLPHRHRAGDLHHWVRPGDADLRQGRGKSVRHPGRGARRGDVAGRVRGVPGRLWRARSGRHRGPDGPAHPPTARWGPRHVSRQSAGRTQPPRS